MKLHFKSDSLPLEEFFEALTSSEYIVQVSFLELPLNIPFKLKPDLPNYYVRCGELTYRYLGLPQHECKFDLPEETGLKVYVKFSDYASEA